MIILQEAINTFSFSPHIDKESPADKPVTCLRDFFRQNRARAASRLKPRGFCLSTWMNPADTSELMWWEIVAGDRPMRRRSCRREIRFLMSLMIYSWERPKTSVAMGCSEPSCPRVPPWNPSLQSTSCLVQMTERTASQDAGYRTPEELLTGSPARRRPRLRRHRPGRKPAASILTDALIH